MRGPLHPTFDRRQNAVVPEPLASDDITLVVSP
jgi:hypothetical protein